uniref:Cytochrome P450 n=1 Tax=Timema genevievae TaxID=629358 RepID=A0A7R9JUR4_TIMGE|nr:unnamed protein product [Timema genevievae]
MYFTVIIVLLCALGIVHYRWRRRLWYLVSKIPGPNGYPLVGSALSLICSNEELLRFLRSNATTYYPTARSLLSESPVLSEKEIYDETLVMILGAYETTATVNGFAIMLLAFHLEIQNKAFQELSDIFGNDQIRPATFQDVQEMKYLEQIIKETLRLYPPVPIIPRTVEEEIKIKNYTLPVGTIVLINLLVTHRHPKSISNPDKFNPDNFSPERKTIRHPCAYTPFSVGLRACVEDGATEEKGRGGHLGYSGMIMRMKVQFWNHRNCSSVFRNQGASSTSSAPKFLVSMFFGLSVSIIEAQY